MADTLNKKLLDSIKTNEEDSITTTEIVLVFGGLVKN